MVLEWEGSGEISILVKDVPHQPEFQVSGTHVMMEIKDEGCGIPSHILDQIFDPYFSSKDTGSGLGLATVYSIINKHGGYLAVESELGKGATFQIFMPAFACEPTEEIKPPVKLNSELKSILVLDDEADVREILSRMLANMGFASISVDDGEKAVLAYKKALATGHPFAAVIVDLTIPGGMGGKETIRRLLQIDPKVKAIVASGYSTDSVMSEYHKFGFLGAIRKPFEQSGLADALIEILGK